jgi:hypothetical protein
VLPLRRVCGAGLSLLCLWLGLSAVTKADPITLPLSGSFNTTFEANCLDAACAQIRSLVAGTGTITLGGTTFSNVQVSIDQVIDNTPSVPLITGTTIFTLPNGDALVLANVGPINPAVNGVAPFSGTFTILSGTGVFVNLTGVLPYTGSATFLSPTGGTGQFTFSGSATVVPEPATLLLLGAGLAGVAARIRCGQRREL